MVTVPQVRKPHIYRYRGIWLCCWTYGDERGKSPGWFVSDGPVGISHEPYLAWASWYLNFRRFYP